MLIGGEKPEAIKLFWCRISLNPLIIEMPQVKMFMDSFWTQAASLMYLWQMKIDLQPRWTPPMDGQICYYYQMHCIVTS